MKISIIIATFNAGNVLRRCLESISDQNIARSQVELIVVDGGSSDGTVDIIKSFLHLVKYWESERDRGIAHAWNKGVAQSTGDWLLFLGADDYLWSANTLTSMAGVLAAREQQSKVVYGNVYAVNKGGEIGRLLSAQWDRDKFVNFGIYFSHQGIFHHKSLFDEFGDIDENFKYGPDYEFLLRYLVNHDAVYVPDITVAAMQMGGISNRPENASTALKDLARARRKHGIRRDSWLYRRAMLGAYAKLGMSKMFGAKLFSRGKS